MRSSIAPSSKAVFTSYEKFVIAILSIIQFTVILDFMILSPLGAILMPELNISTFQFGLVVSAYAISAGLSGLLAAGFADKFDRKKLLLFFYIGFIIGTFLCAIATDHRFLLFARIVTGLFGGVISSIGFAIVTDTFKMEVRGRVMGFVQMSFAITQVIGIPIGLYLANHFGWHFAFFMIVGLCILTALAILFYLKPVTSHLNVKSERNPIQHLLNTLSNPDYQRGFLATVFLATGGFMLMPFASKFATNNLGITMDQFTLMYTITGVFSVFFGPFIGKFSDKYGAYKMFVVGSIVSIIAVVFYTRLGITPLWLVQTINTILFVAVACRIITSSTLITAVPSLQDRGAFMSINSSVQQFAGGIASGIAGLIVVDNKKGILEHYDILGNVVVVTTFFTMAMMYVIHLQIARKKLEASSISTSSIQPENL